MTEEAQVSEGLSVQSAQPVSTSPVAPVTPKTYSDEDVDRIVSAKKQKAYEKGYEDARAALLQTQSTQQPAQINNQADTLSSDKLKELARAEAKAEYEQQQNELRKQQFIHEFAAKMESGKQKHADFEQTVTSLQLQTIPEVVQLANVFDNTSDIMYDLAKNPAKVAPLLVLAKTAPHLALQEMQRLSHSIKQNEAAVANQPNVREPLSQVKPSNVGVDNGSHTVADWRKQDWLRG